MTTDTDTLVALLGGGINDMLTLRDMSQPLAQETIANRARIEALEAEVARLQRDWDESQGRLTGSRASLAAMTAQLTEARAGEDELAAALQNWTDALDAKREFERENPNNSTKAWERLFYEIQFAEEAARAAVTSHAKRKEGR